MELNTLIGFFYFFNAIYFMVSTFKGKFYYYENINGKEKKVEKEFTDAKKYSDFVNQYPMPSLSSFWGLETPKLATPKKKALPKKKVVKAKKAPTKKKVVKKKK